MIRVSFLGLLLIAASCSTSKVVSYTNDESGIARAKSFGLIRSNKKENLNSDQDKMDSVMLNTMKEELVRLGYQPSGSPNLFFEYSVVLNTSSESRVNQPNYYDRRYYYPYSYNYNVTNYEYREGVVIVEAKKTNGKLVWQGSLSFKVSNKKASTRELLLNTLREVTASFPPRD